MGTNLDLYVLLKAKDMASKTIRQVNKEVGGLGRTAGRVGGALKTAAIGAAAIGTTIVAANIKSGIDSLAELESAVTSVQGALNQMGLAGQVTGQQVADWANEIEAATDAAFDDKAIVRATTNLIRYGKVTPKNLRKTMEVMTDLAAKTGSVESASTQLAKALADPAKAAGKLTRMGIVLTKSEQDQIKALVKAGKTAKAQALLLDILAKSTEGAAKASAGPYQDAMNKLGDAVEDAQRALAIGFLPVIQEVADWLQRELVKPSTIASIKEFGKSLAGGLKAAVEWARKLPWAEITDGLKSAAGFAKTLIDAFMSMPTEVKGLIIALIGLNKLSGGAVGGIVSELSKGLIRGVLGMTAGVVNLTAGVVNGGGLPGGGTPAPAGKGGSTGALGTVVKGAAKLILPFLPAAIAIGASEAIASERNARVEAMSTADLQKYVAQLQKSIDHPAYGPMGARRQMQDADELQRALAVLNARNATQTVKLDKINAGAATIAGRVWSVATGVGTVRAAQQQVGRVTSGIGARISAAVNSTTSAVKTDTAVLRGKNFKPVVRVSVSTPISVRTVVNGQAVTVRYNPGHTTVVPR